MIVSQYLPQLARVATFFALILRFSEYENIFAVACHGQTLTNDEGRSKQAPLFFATCEAKFVGACSLKMATNIFAQFNDRASR